MDKDQKTLELFNQEALSNHQKKAIQGRDKGSDSYDRRTPDFRRRIGEYIYLKKLDLKSSRGLILDAGCGTGWYTLKILEAGGKVVAADYSLECLKVCRSKCGSNQKNFFPVVADLKNLPFKKDAFDRILMAEVYQHIPLVRTRMGILRQFYEILKPKGKLILATYNFKIHDLLKKDKEALINEFYYYRYSCKELKQELREVFKNTFEIIPIMNIFPLSRKLGNTGVRLDCFFAKIPLICYLRGHLLLATAKK